MAAPDDFQPRIVIDTARGVPLLVWRGDLTCAGQTRAYETGQQAAGASVTDRDRRKFRDHIHDLHQAAARGDTAALAAYAVDRHKARRTRPA